MGLGENNSTGHHPKLSILDFEKKTNDRFSSLEHSLSLIATDIHAIKELMNTWLTHVTDKEKIHVETVYKLIMPLVKTVCWMAFAIVTSVAGLKYLSPILDRIFG